MKHIKKFENLNMLTDWGYLLSDEDFKKYADEFDDIVDVFIDYADSGYDIKFETAYGAKVLMSYDDYIEKNLKYQEFIHGLPRRVCFFIVYIKMPYDFKNFINILNDVNQSTKRIESMGWVINSFKTDGKTDYQYPSPFISISYEFEKES